MQQWAPRVNAVPIAGRGAVDAAVDSYHPIAPPQSLSPITASTPGRLAGAQRPAASRAPAHTVIQLGRPVTCAIRGAPRRGPRAPGAQPASRVQRDALALHVRHVRAPAAALQQPEHDCWHAQAQAQLQAGNG